MKPCPCPERIALRAICMGTTPARAAAQNGRTQFAIARGENGDSNAHAHLHGNCRPRFPAGLATNRRRGPEPAGSHLQLLLAASLQQRLGAKHARRTAIHQELHAWQGCLSLADLLSAAAEPVSRFNRTRARGHCAGRRLLHDAQPLRFNR